MSDPEEGPGQEVPLWLDGISGEYLRPLIESDAHLIRVIAGPGSGKTTGIKRRVQRLIQGKGVPAERIFAGTFTRAIAGELRGRSRRGSASRLCTPSPAACSRRTQPPSAYASSAFSCASKRTPCSTTSAAFYRRAGCADELA